MKPNTLVTIAVNSSLLEIRTWPKPGNVHKTHNFSQSTYQDFLTVAYLGTSTWTSMLKSLQDSSFTLNEQYISFLNLAVKRMMTVQSGGNVLLGHYLLNIPLFISAHECMRLKEYSKSLFWSITHRILNESTPQDTIGLYNAIREAHPGGMGTRKLYDLYSPTINSELLQDNINLIRIFEISKDYDSISETLSSNYHLIRTQVIPIINLYLEDYPNLRHVFPEKMYDQVIQNDLQDISVELNELILRVYLYILAQNPDTLIIRKTSKSHTMQVSQHAEELLNVFSEYSRKEWIKLVLNFDETLQKAGGKLNPGTTADLLACSLFAYLIEHLFYRKN